MPSGYRDDLAAVEERLTRLDAAHVDREVRERREALEDERRAIPGEPRRKRAAVTAVVFVAAFLAVQMITQGMKHPATGNTASLVVFALAMLLGTGAGLWLAWDRWQRSNAFARVDAQLAALQKPRVRVAATNLAEAHARIAVREHEERRTEEEAADRSSTRRLS